MEMNKVSKKTIKKNNTKTRKTINKEGAEVVYDNLYRQVILQGITLNPKRNTFYFSDKEHIQNYLNTLKKFIEIEKDTEFLEKVTMYLAKEHGRKLSPVFIQAFLMNMDNLEKIELDNLFYDKYINTTIYPTPKFIADMIASMYYITGKNMYKKYLLKDLNNNFFKDSEKVRLSFKNVFEKYSSLTLKKWKLKNRKINTSYIIQWVKPNPVYNKEETKYISKLYKSIIENDSFASLKDEETITSMLTSTKKTKEEKKEYIEKNVDTIPLNALIRNLNQYVTASDETIYKLKKRLNSLITSLENGDTSSLRVFDILSLLNITLNNYELEGIIDKLLRVYFEMEKNKGEIISGKSIYLIDISSSMGWFSDGGNKTASAFITYLSYLTNLKESIIYNFNYNIALNERLIKVVNKYKESPLKMYREIYKYLQKINEGGTDVTSSIKKVSKMHPKTDNIIVITDEVSWVASKNFLDKTDIKNINQKLIFFNTDMSDGKVVVDSEKVVRLTGINYSTSKILRMFSGNIKDIVKYIKETY